MSRSYAAILFPASGGQVRGFVELDAGGLRFQSETQLVELPWDGLQFQTGGFNGEQVFASHSAHAGVSIQITDAAFLHDPFLTSRSSFAAKAARLAVQKKKMPLPVKIGLLILLLIGAFFVLLILNADRLVDAAVSRIPRDAEVKFGDMVFESMKSQMKFIEDERRQKRLDAILARLKPVQDSGYDFRLHVVEDEAINAFAMPGGNIVVFTGLMNAAATNEELAGVIAHEMAHVIRRHSLRKIVKSSGLSVMLALLVGDASALAGLVSQTTGMLGESAFSRDYEREADETGWQILLAAKVEPRGMIRIFHRFKDEEAKGLPMPGLLRSHPATDDRIERLEENAKELPASASYDPIQ
jgi:beta-barrel assembly-enhancing protease